MMLSGKLELLLHLLPDQAVPVLRVTVMLLIFILLRFVFSLSARLSKTCRSISLRYISLSGYALYQPKIIFAYKSKLLTLNDFIFSIIRLSKTCSSISLRYISLSGCALYQPKIIFAYKSKLLTLNDFW